MPYYKCNTADRPYRPRRPPGILRPARPTPSYKCNTADRPYRRRRPLDVLMPARPMALVHLQYSRRRPPDVRIPTRPMVWYTCNTADRSCRRRRPPDVRRVNSKVRKSQEMSTIVAQTEHRRQGESTQKSRTKLRKFWKGRECGVRNFPVS